MKIHKINGQGSLAVVIPKDIATVLGWKQGQDVVVNTTNDDSIIKIVNKSLHIRKER